ncbi:MAG: zinc ribbon domain-containing protein [Ruminococcaceae bacterium]|nr:zinc ribbon domain-containing protein [Oscillospiraceae bacterium]
MFCPNCGTQVPDGSLFCTSCGAQFGATAVQTAPPAEQYQYQQPVQQQPYPQDAQFQQQPYPQQQPYQQPMQPYQQPYQQQYQQGAQGQGEAKMTVRTASLLCYWFSFVGWLLSYLFADNTDPFLRFHLNQSLIFWIASAVAGTISRIPVIGFVGSLLFVGLFVLKVIAFLGAYNGQTKWAPLLDKYPIQLLK